MDAEKIDGEWDQPRELQIDSYATGQQIANADVRQDGSIHIALTDGSKSWNAVMRPPKGWNPWRPTHFK